MTKKDFIKYFETLRLDLKILDVIYYGDDERHNDIYLLGAVNNRDGRYYVFDGSCRVWQIPEGGRDRNGHVVLELAEILILANELPIVHPIYLQIG